jgi:hypothetical protein
MSQATTDGGDTVDDVDAYMENHPLTTLFDDTPRTRLLIVFLEAGEPLNPSRIIEQAGIGQNTWYTHRDELVESGIIVESGHAGNSPLYRIADPDEDGVTGLADERAVWLDKIADYTARAVHGFGDESDSDGGA